MDTQPVTIPPELMKKRRWRGTIFLFSKHPKLQQYFTNEYFDLASRSIETTKLRSIAKPWSESEKFALNLALHLNGITSNVDLSNMDYLDSSNKQLAFEALRLRYS